MTNVSKFGLRLLIFASVAFTTLSCSSSLVSESVDDNVGEITWSVCSGENAPEAPFECGSVYVPVDYDNPDGDKISIALVRIPASTEKEYLGVILLNPGGPGVSGFDSLVDMGEELVNKLGLSSFDLISFDPRGVDRSGGLRCYSDAELDKFLYVDSTPDDDKEQALFDESEKDESTCEEKLGPSIKFYSTENIARDMDIIRAGLLVNKINYLGISYGTYLGGVYATLFPDRVASMVLDAAYDPQGDTVEEEYLTNAVGFEKAFAKWVDWCQKESECKFQATDVAEKWDALYSRLDKKSAISTSGRDVNHRVVRNATILALYAESLWPILASALQKADEGKPDSLLELADWKNDRQEDGTYLTSKYSQGLINCASGFEKPLPKNPSEIFNKLKQLAPWYSRELELSDFDEPWCEEIFKKQKLFVIDYQGNAPILVIGGENDPATPIRWAEEMLLNMGTNASLIRFTGEGHSQILGSKCVDAIASDLFTQNIVPKSNTVCNPDKPIPKPAWWADIPPDAMFGQILDTSELLEILGLKSTNTYSEFRAVPGNLDEVFARIYKAFDDAEFSSDCDAKIIPIEEPCFFWLSESEIGVLILSEEEIKEWKLEQPDIPIPDGSHLIEFYYWP